MARLQGKLDDAVRRADAQRERALDLPGAAHGAGQAERLSGARGRRSVPGIARIAALTALLSIEHLTVRFGATRRRRRRVADDRRRARSSRSSASRARASRSPRCRCSASSTARARSGRIVFDGNDLRALGEPQMRAIRGGEIAMIFQEPMTALNPLHTIGAQIVEVLAAAREARPRRGARARRSPSSTAPASPSRRAASTPSRTSSRAASASAR